MPIPRKLKPWRGFPSVNAVHGIRARVNNTAPLASRGEFSIGKTAFGATTRTHIGTVPAGAVLVSSYRRVEEAFAATTTINVVKADGTVVYNILAAGVTTNGAGSSLDVPPVLTAAANMPTVDTPLYLETGVIASTSGIVDICIQFYMNKD